MEIEYPTRCEIVDPQGHRFNDAYVMNTPGISRPHIGKRGLAERINENVRITLDSGGVLYGYQCWWIPIEGRTDVRYEIGVGV